MQDIILFSVATLPVILLGMYIYKKDKNKESPRLLTKLFLGGIISCFMVLIISFILELIFPFFALEEETLNYFELIISVFIGVALVEEVCKWIIVYVISYNDNEYEEIYDSIVYCTFVALGFAFFENLFYVYESGIGTGIMRAILSVPGHVCDGVFMGYYLGLAKQSIINGNKKLATKNLILSILVPTILHGIYDYCLFTGNNYFLLIFIIFVIVVYVLALKKIKTLSSIGRKFKNNDNYCTNCGTPVNGNYCVICGKKHN